MSYLLYLCLSLCPVVCRRAHVLFTLFVFVFIFKQLEIKTNTNKVNKTCALLQTTGNKDKHK
jgi:hypothetical protein